MPHRAARAATLPNVNAFNVRARPVAFAKYRRKLLGGVALGLGAVAAVAAMGGAATIAAAWLLSSSLSSNSNLRPAGVVVLEAADMPRPHRTLTETASLVGAPHSVYEAPETVVAEVAPAEAPARTAVAAPEAIPLPPSRQAPPKRVAEQTNEIPMPPAHPLVAPPVASHTPVQQTPVQQTPVQQASAKQQLARAPMPPPQPVEPQVPAAPAAAPAPAPAPATASITDFLKRLTPRLAYNNPDVRTPDTHTAVYDIEAHTVFMPGGEKLEAHSGLGNRMDDPRYVSEKARGATPPNVYDLTLREEIFHGVRAIRLTPVTDSKMYGRDVNLAHTYMLGSSGQSFGCVSFREYEKFLQAYLHGEVNRIVVVSHYDSSAVTAAARREGDKPYAFANP
jgi:hypothetical protein